MTRKIVQMLLDVDVVEHLSTKRRLIESLSATMTTTTTMPALTTSTTEVSNFVTSFA